MINSAVAHTDERNWNVGTQGKGREGYHPVTEFWGQRFLVPSTNTSVSDSGRGAETAASPRFSLDRYKGAWIPFGGGIHQCPARHWIKTQMLLSLAVIVSTFEIELLNDGIGGAAGKGMGKGVEVEVDEGRHGLGASYPARKVGFRIRRR